MSDCDKIKIPEGEFRSIRIQAPHCKDFRWNDDILIFTPVIDAFKKVGLIPPPSDLMERAESSLSRVEFTYHDRPLSNAGDVKEFGDALRKGIKSLRAGDTYYASDRVDFYLREILRPDDLTFEQRIAIFDFFATKVLGQVEEDYYHKTDYHYHFHRFEPPADYIERHCTLKEWNDSERTNVENRVADLINAQTAMRNMAGYDWSPMSFFFGAELERLTKLKTAALNAEMETSLGIFKREFGDFLDALQKASQLGTMRSNRLQFESILLGKYRIRVCINDIGGGAKFSRAVRDNEIVGFARDIGGAGKGLSKFLFGRK